MSIEENGNGVRDNIESVDPEFLEKLKLLKTKATEFLNYYPEVKEGLGIDARKNPEFYIEKNCLLLKMHVEDGEENKKLGYFSELLNNIINDNSLQLTLGLPDYVSGAKIASIEVNKKERGKYEEDFIKAKPHNILAGHINRVASNIRGFFRNGGAG